MSFSAKWNRRAILATLSLAAACSSETAPATSGAIRVAVTTAGQQLDPDGYEVILDGTTTKPVAIDGTVEFAGITVGAHSIQLSRISSNCTPDWYAPQNADVAADGTADLTYAVTCAVPLSGRIVFGSDQEHVQRNIYSMANDGSAITRLDTFALQGNDQPQLSPAGTRIVFIRFDSGNPDVWAMNADGSGATNLTNSPDRWEEEPHWAPDGSKLVYLVRSTDGRRDVVVATADGRSDSVVYSSTLGLDAPAWAPDGGSIAFNQSDELRLLNLATGIATVVGKALFFPTWTPDGDRITVSTPRPGGASYDLVNVLPDGSDPRVILADIPGALGPAWSPDGSRLAFTGSGSGGYLDIFSVRSDGTNLSNLTNGPSHHSFWPSWSP